MKNGIIAILVSILGVVIIGILWGVTNYFSYNNEEVELRARADAQLKVIETEHDNMWKVLQTEANVVDKYAKDFKGIFTAIIEGRYSHGSQDGSLMKWIKESNPEFSSAKYDKLMTIIEQYRLRYLHAQDVMIQINKEHTVLLTKYPSRWFISNKEPINFQPITSTRSKKVMELGVDDEDVNLFDNKETTSDNNDEGGRQ